MNRLTQVEIMNALALGIPLYTHPVKELTDEEIVNTFTYEYGMSDYYSDTHQWAIEFARAILRKAQEK